MDLWLIGFDVFFKESHEAVVFEEVGVAEEEVVAVQACVVILCCVLEAAPVV